MRGPELNDTAAALHNGDGLYYDLQKNWWAWPSTAPKRFGCQTAGGGGSKGPMTGFRTRKGMEVNRNRDTHWTKVPRQEIQRPAHRPRGWPCGTPVTAWNSRRPTKTGCTATVQAAVALQTAQEAANALATSRPTGKLGATILKHHR